MDNELKIARSLDLLLNETQMLPSILILNEKLEVEWLQRGRNVLYFGDPELWNTWNVKDGFKLNSTFIQSGKSELTSPFPLHEWDLIFSI